MELGADGPFGSEMTSGQDRREVVGRDAVAEALEACSANLEAQLAAGAQPEALCASIKAFAVVARQHEVPPERALAVFKKMVARLKGVDRHPVDARGEMVRHLVQMAIDTYYQANTDDSIR